MSHLSYPVCDQRIVVGGRRSGLPWLGPGLVRVVCALPGLFRKFFTISRTYVKRNTLVSYLSLSAKP